MHLLTVILLGLIQGLTEFIPVSSSGHLIIGEHLLNFDAGLVFDVALHIGTLAAVLAVFWDELWGYARALIAPSKHTKMAQFLVLATVPAFLFGVVLQKRAESTFRSPQLVAVDLIVFGLIMLAVDRFAALTRDLNEMTAGRALFIGLAQCLALVPGVSRSGSTIVAGELTGLDRVSATRFAFLMAAPVTLGAIGFELIKPPTIKVISNAPVDFAVGVLVAFIAGILAIRFLLRYIGTHGLAAFGYYRVLLGVAVILAGVK